MTAKILKKGMIVFAALVLSTGLMMGKQAQEVYGAETGSTASSNAYLKSLSVDPGTMSPEFSPEITSYTITVGEDVDRISVTCSTAESDSKVIEAGGFKNLELGSNDAIVTVQAADGTKCSYHLTINRGTASSEEAGTASGENQAADEEDGTGQEDGDSESGENASDEDEVSTQVGVVPTSMSTESTLVGGESIFASFQVNATFPQELLPDGFVEEEYDYKGMTVQSAYFAAGDLRLLYLSAGDGTSSDFRIYYEDTDTFMDFLQLKGTDGKFIMPVRYQAQIKIPDNYTGSYLPWGDKVISCYIYTELTDNPITVSNGEEQEEGTTENAAETEPVHVEDLDEEVEFYLLYAMNNEGGENFYLYDSVEGTYQRYVERDTSYELDQSYFKYKDLAHQRFALMCVLGVLLLIAVFCIINLVIRNRELKADLEDEDDGGDDPDGDGSDGDKGNNGGKGGNNHRGGGNGDRDGSDAPQKKKKSEAPGEKRAEKTVKKEPDAEAEPAAPAKKQTKAKEAVKAAPAKKQQKAPKQEPEFDTASLEEKIIGQLQQEAGEPESVKREPEKREPERTKKPSNFKMINLSREPEPTGLDDDFEFEFINLDDD